ncbi:GNAT family N-acetyltransferase [Pseudonocardia xinjiangensis]|uniref:GNAT family N-acetyltransferase n=1 Tax=Pseudonocardia xinjiangensis TaxID=75289 RepID=UPI003D8F4AAF
MTLPDPWPLRRLALCTPRLELRPDDDDGLLELVEEAHRGVHPPDEMPFLVPWTDHVGHRTLQHYWSQRAQFGPENWTLNFLVRLDGRVVGMQGLTGQNFGLVREVKTGSWIGLRHQRRGIGTEMRAAVLAFAFDHLGAVRARSSAFSGNVASLRVSERLGYQHDGTETVVRRGRAGQDVRLLVTSDRFVRPDWALRVEGLDPCRELLGVPAQ